MIRLGNITRYNSILASGRTVFGPSVSMLTRGYAKKPAQTGDITQVPVKNIGVMADFYIPPKFLSCPVTSWHKLIFRRLGLFVVNTYSIVKFKRETTSGLHFNEWKDNAIDLYVKTNKIFAAACCKKPSERAAYLKSQLEDISGVEVIKSLVERAGSFPQNSKLKWELDSVVGNPKVVSFNALPDANNNTAYVQFVMKVTTKQNVTVTLTQNTQESEKAVTDYLVYSFDPWTKQMYLVGTLFESDHIRKVTPDDNFTNPKYMLAFSKSCGDIYRSNPKVKKIDAKKD